MRPRRPARISSWAEACLRAIAREGLGNVISLGGALGLMHYVEYRETHDLDAWWNTDAAAAERNRLLAVVEETLAGFGKVERRSWGDVVSIDLHEGGKAVFRFQVATRSALLEHPERAPWVEVDLDSLSDLLASKMVALVERGAPRDFRDIYKVCKAGLATPKECWTLWERRQSTSGSDAERARARLAVETHLERIARHRPLEKIADPAARADAEAVRTWFRKELFDALRD